jgi:hypothetical protein
VFGPLEQHLGARRFHNDKEVEMTFLEWLRMKEPDFYRQGIIFKHVSRWDKCINVFGDYVEK